MKCNFCDRLMVSLYITEPKSVSKTKKAIGKICVKCGIVNSPSPYFQKLKQNIVKDEETELNRQGFNRKKPKHLESREYQCSNCKSKRFDKRRFNQPKWSKYQNSDGSDNWQLNNPYIRYTCKKCKKESTLGLEMPYPLPKKYRIPPKN